ncbi:DUF2332 domain-containing protein [soil metagenome]
MPLPAAIVDHFHDQAKASEELGSQFTALLCRQIADRLDPAQSRFGQRIAAWPSTLRDDALSLRAAGGLHALARSGRVPALTAAYPPNPTDPAALWAAVVAAIAAEDAFLFSYLDSPPQTNEVARSSVILGGCLHIARETGLPLEVYEIGSSTGLNLAFDRYRYDLGAGAWGAAASPVTIASRWEGDLPPVERTLTIAARAGCDVRPLDPGSPTDRARLISYIWPDQALRLARTHAALTLAAQCPWRVVRADAAEWVREGLQRTPASGVTRVIFHTVVWPYLPLATRDSITHSIHAAGAAATASTPLAWLSMEPDEDKGSAAVRLTIWPSGKTRHLGRADFHGRWVKWEYATAPRG